MVSGGGDWRAPSGRPAGLRARHLHAFMGVDVRGVGGGEGVVGIMTKHMRQQSCPPQAGPSRAAGGSAGRMQCVHFLFICGWRGRGRRKRAGAGYSITGTSLPRLSCLPWRCGAESFFGWCGRVWGGGWWGGAGGGGRVVGVGGGGAGAGVDVVGSCSLRLDSYSSSPSPNSLISRSLSSLYAQNPSARGWAAGSVNV